MIPYSDANSKEAINKIGEFRANMGGTELLRPIKLALDQKLPDDIQKRVFILTDGFTDNKKKVFETIRDHCKENNKTKVFSIGISSCDKELVQKAAEYGNGAHVLIDDNDLSILKEAVMTSLRRAGVPALQFCSFNFGNGQREGFRDGELYLGGFRDLGTLYQSEVVRIFAIMTEQEFERMHCEFKCGLNPTTNKPFSKKIRKDEF